MRATVLSLTVTPLPDRVVLRIPLTARVPFRLEEERGRLTLRLYNTVSDINWTRYGPDVPRAPGGVLIENTSNGAAILQTGVSAVIDGDEDSIPASATTTMSTSECRSWNCLTIGMIVVVSALLSSQQPISSGNP